MSDVEGPTRSQMRQQLLAQLTTQPQLFYSLTPFPRPRAAAPVLPQSCKVCEKLKGQGAYHPKLCGVIKC